MTLIFISFLCAEGALKLSFEPSLKLQDVEMENKGMSKGVYKPPDCIARESVAILIPHRSRERHLLYLMHHLHPFLQRQQLHYAIYVIQQVGLLLHTDYLILKICKTICGTEAQRYFPPSFVLKGW